MPATKAITVEQAHAIISRMDKVGGELFGDAESELRAIDDELGQWCGEGQLRADLSGTAHAMGPDYICALEDGSILAWGADRRVGREIVIVTERSL